MPSVRQTFIASMLLAVAHGQGVILRAQGPKGPASKGLLVDQTKADANIINKNEIVQNVVNECGRTLLAGNMDVGENTEIALSNKTVTQVTKGSTVDVDIAQGNDDGKGPYTCDMDLQSNAAGATGQVPLKVQESNAKNGIISLKVQLPNDFDCIGASTGDVCTIRCFNSAQAGPFGGCFAVQQTDVTPNKNAPANIKTIQQLDGVMAQILQNQKDLETSIKANQQSANADDTGVQAVNLLLNIDSKSQAKAPPAAEAAAGLTGGNGGNNNNNNNNNGNGRGGNGGNRGGNGGNGGNGNGRGGNGGNGANRGGNANNGNGNGANGANRGGNGNNANGNGANGANRGGNGNNNNNNNNANGNGRGGNGGNGNNGNANGNGRNNKRDSAARRSLIAKALRERADAIAARLVEM